MNVEKPPGLNSELLFRPDKTKATILQINRSSYYFVSVAHTPAEKVWNGPCVLAFTKVEIPKAGP